MAESSEIRIVDSNGNPAPLGLCGFGLTTILLNIHNAGFFPLDTTIMAMGIFYGGLAQVIVGVMEWKKKNTFGTTAFTSYGLFWLSLVAIWVIPEVGHVKAPSNASMSCYLALWGIFTFFLFLGTLKSGVAIRVVFFSLFVLFALLAAGKAMSSNTIMTIAGYVGIFCGASAFYTAMGEVLNEVYKKKIMPL